MSVKKLFYQVKFLSSRENVSHYQEAISDFFQNINYDKFEKNIDIGDVKTSINEFIYDELCEMSIVISCLGIKHTSDFVSYAIQIHKAWCKAALNNDYLIWLIPDNGYINSPTLIPVGNLIPNSISFGTLPRVKEYVQTCFFKTVGSSILCNFNHLQREVIILISVTHKRTCSLTEEVGYKMSFTYDSIIRILANLNSELEAAEFFVQLEYPPFMYIAKSSQLKETADGTVDKRTVRVTKVKEMEYNSKQFERTFTMGCYFCKNLISSKNVGKNLVLKFVVPDKFQLRWNLEQLSLRCAKKTEICFTSVETHITKKEDRNRLKCLPHSIFEKSKLDKEEIFSCEYAWSVLHSRSDVISHQIALNNLKCFSYEEELLRIILDYVKSNVSALVNTLYCIADMVDRGVIFDFLHVMESKFLHFTNFVEINELPKGMVYARRVLIMPSRILFLRPFEHFDNRIIRKFGVEYMLRCSIRDDNFSKLTYAVQYNSKKEEIMQNVVANVLLKGIKVGSRKYEMLAASNSQLREHGIWFYAEDSSNNTASSIRQWMGDFSKIRNVAKYMARMGQCLSTTESGVQILIKEEEEILLEDIKTRDGRYIFSDGIGTLSSELAEEVRQSLLRSSYTVDTSVTERSLYKPIAFQIRYKGCKGMLVEYPVSGRKLGIRPSMKKFECTTSNYLEIVKASAPRRLFLNKHLITILEQMGVPKTEFINLELKMILHHLDSLMNEKVAANLLAQSLSGEFPFHSLQKAGFGLTNEPFFRSLLLAYFKSFAEKLKVNMRIAVPDEYGRNMFGVLDETKTLKYGEVFVQYSKSLTDPNVGFEILKGPVLVTKNPSLHPGDVRKLKAVDVAALHHIKDCIVFPAQGKRPHPDEMAGSDLDGDEMIVLWYRPLIFHRKSAKPMDYPVYNECFSKQVKLPDTVDFFCKYIQNDNIGTFAHAHLVWADRLKNGIFSEKCMDIAQRYPYVLDFAKHGTTNYLKSSERPYYYPDFLEKGVRGNTYHSHKVLGSIYRTSRVLNACSSKISLNSEILSYDTELDYPGWKSYEKSAEMHRKEYCAKVLEVLQRYSLSNEAEAFADFVEMKDCQKWREEKSNAVKVVNKYLSSIKNHYRNLFFTEFKKECKENNLSEDEKLEKKYQRASAWYMVVYGRHSTRVLSFPWVLSEILIDIKRKRTKTTCSFDSPLINFFYDIDRDIRAWCSLNEIIYDKGNCMCIYLLKKITLLWITKSGLNFGIHDDSVYCHDCYDRIFTFYKSKSNMYCCSRFSETLCKCNEYCSAAKVIIDFLKFLITNVDTLIGNCSKDNCNGFLAKNLQELALQTYSFIAITRNISYLGIHFNTNNFMKNAVLPNVSEIMFEDEGDPIKISANADLKHLIDYYREDIEDFLKKISGVKVLTLTPDPHSNCLIVSSIGKNWQRWNLQEVLLDTNFIENLKKNLNISN